MKTYSYKPRDNEVAVMAPEPKRAWPKSKRQFALRISDMRYQRNAATQGMINAARAGRITLSDQYRKRRLEIDLEIIKLEHDMKDAPQ